MLHVRMVNASVNERSRDGARLGLRPGERLTLGLGLAEGVQHAALLFV